MASQKPVADTLADKFAKAQQRGKKDASKGSATRRTRSKGALEDSSSEEEVFQSPTLIMPRWTSPQKTVSRTLVNM
jgi:hypothetical protein